MNLFLPCCATCHFLQQHKSLCASSFSFPSQAKDWSEILQFLLSSSNKDIQYRGTVIVYLLACHDKESAERVIDTHCKVFH